MPVYTDQELLLFATDVQDRDMDAVDFRVDYWSPANRSKTPTGTIVDTDITTAPGSPLVIIKIASGIMNIPASTGFKWRFQIIDNTNGVAWTTMCVTVKNAGAC